ncbi:MAG: hypothetical protein LC687_01580 [Actinobacteria bacterium]|nr:hypothetical protein [Actinomycetota bacterium]
MNQFLTNLKAQAEQNPIIAIGVTAALLTATSKLLDANTDRVSAKTHAREIDRRIAMSHLK